MIYYRFYDPQFKGTPKWGILRKIKRMNEFKELEQRVEVTKALIDKEMYMLIKEGYNPITGISQTPAPNSNKSFIDTWFWACDQLEVEHKVKIDIKSALNKIRKVSQTLFDTHNGMMFYRLSLHMIGRRQVKELLENLGTVIPTYSNYRYNRIKAYISMLYNILLNEDMVDDKPTTNIPNKKVLKKLRPVMTKEEEIKIDQHLRSRHYHYWRFMRLFYDCQARETELLQLRKNDRIRLERQEIIVTVKKGGQFKEDIRVISKSMIPLWEEVLSEAKDNEVLFSKCFKPGPKSIGSDKVSGYWRKLVKKELGINKDFYSLKHLSTDRMSEFYGLQLASAGAGHTNTHTTSQYYAVGEKSRKINLLKSKVIGFGE